VDDLADCALQFNIALHRLELLIAEQEKKEKLRGGGDGGGGKESGTRSK
jgi:hypothetical protein